MSILTNLLYWKLKRSGYQEKWTPLRTPPQGYKIFSVQKAGLASRPWVVLVHGIGANLTHWHVVLDILNQQGYNVLAFELPGHGKNKDLTGVLTSDRLFELTREFLDSLPFKSFVLVGNSLGGGVSIEYSLTHPERVQKLMLISPVVPFETEEQWEGIKKGLLLKTRDDAGRFLKKVYDRPPKILPLILGTVIEDFNRKGVLDLLHTTTIEKTRGNLDRSLLKVKTLFIWGQSEKFFGHAYLDLHKKLLPSHVIYEEPPQIGHCPQLDRPGWVAKRIDSFLSDL